MTAHVTADGHDLSRLLVPGSVAVVGANERPGSYGGNTLLNLQRAGFAGAVYGVNPTRRSALGVPCVPRIRDLPGPVDVVVVATPAATVAQVLDESAALGCGSAVVYAAGFAELGATAAQHDALAPAARHGMPVLGPNCNGLVAVAARAPLWGDVATLPERAGPVALITQSGNLGVVGLAHRGGTGLHTVVSVGNAALVDVPTVLGALALQPGVRAVAVYAEGDGDGAAWAAALGRCAESDVRVVVLKAGRSTAGRAAGAAHTAAVAGDHRVFVAFVAEAGGVMVGDPHELLETARALAAGRRHPGGVAILTCSGGDAALAADLASDAGAVLAVPSDRTRARLAGLLPSGVTVGNPLDHTNAVWADTSAVADITATLAGDPDVGHVLYVQDEPAGLAPGDAAEWAATRAGALSGARKAGHEALLVASCPGQEPAGAVAGLRPALAAVAALQQPAPDPARLRAIAGYARAAAERRVGTGAPGPMGETESKALLRAHGIDTPPSGVADGPVSAVAAADRLGYPVALKVSAAGLLHKSEAGAVELDLATPAAVAAAAARLLALPGLPVDPQLLVEAMAGDGVDLIVAVRTDGVVPALLVGTGGIWVELLDDVAVIPLPADADRVQAAVASLRSAGMLTGGRGRAPLAVAALAVLATRVATVAAAERLLLLELNPVRVTTRTAIALDALAVRPGPGPMASVF